MPMLLLFKVSAGTDVTAILFQLDKTDPNLGRPISSIFVEKET